MEVYNRLVKPMCIYIISKLCTVPEATNNAEVIIGYLRNLHDSILAGIEVMKKGHYPFIPGLDLLVYLLMGNNPCKLPYESALEWLKKCDAVLLLNGLDESVNVRTEYQTALLYNKHVFTSIAEIPAIS